MKTKNVFSVWVSALLLLLAAACTNNPCDCEQPMDLRPMSVAEEQVVEASNDFAFDIFKRLSQDEDHLFISPFSISTALAMTANGAAGDTRAAIKTAIHLPGLSDEEMNQAYSDLADFLLHLDDQVIIELANSSWYRQDLTIREAFKSILLEYYDAEILAADFSNPATKDIINGWIEEKTHDRIKDMIDQIPADVVMYLINAIYFKADWKYQFDESKTMPSDFFLENGGSVRTDMMYSKGVKVNYYYNNEALFVEIPYSRGQFHMTIIMPQHDQTVQQIIDNTTAQQFRDYSLAADTATVALYLPKFKMEYKTLLNDVLSEMGMGIAFGAGADLSNLFVQALDLLISRVIHQSFIDVNEKGSEAAAATVVEIIETSVNPGDPPSVISINKPFAFYITEKHSNTVLFAGKMTNPSKL
jgi:serpin B